MEEHNRRTARSLSDLASSDHARAGDVGNRPTASVGHRGHKPRHVPRGRPRILAPDDGGLENRVGLDRQDSREEQLVSHLLL